MPREPNGSVLRSTFQHLPGVGPFTEAELWRRGVTTWDRFRAASLLPGISAERRRRLEREIDAAERALHESNAGWFAHRLPPTEYWRLYPDFRSSTAFLDIETT